MEDDLIQEYIPDALYHSSEEDLDGLGHILKLDGELDMFVAPSIGRRLHEFAEGGHRKVVVDLSEARFIDTTVLTELVAGQKDLQDHQGALAVIASRPYTRRTFELTGLNDVLRVCGSRDEAASLLA